MANANEDNQNKFLVILNYSETVITLYAYVGWAPLCKFSTTSKIINPNQKCLYYEKTVFKFEIFSKSSDDKTAKRLLGPEKWKEDKVITITESLECQQENFIENERQICLRNVYREEELVHGNLYDILGLDMNEERKKKNEDLKNAIRKAWKKQLLIWHPDKNFGSVDVAFEINFAKEILMDDGARARYHNAFDYDKGCFSIKGWKAILCPECGTEEQKISFCRRILMGLLSLGLAVGGIALSFGTAGAATPVVVILGGIFGTGLTVAGLETLGHTMSRKSVIDEYEWKSWFYKAGIGFVTGAITGGAGVGITHGIVGIGRAAMQSSAVLIGRRVGMGSATGAVGGVVLSLSSDFIKKYVDKEKVTLKQVAFHAVSQAAIGAGVGALGGIFTEVHFRSNSDSRTSAATSTLTVDVVEQVSATTGGRRIGPAVGKFISKKATTGATKSLLGIATNVVDERLDDSVENQKLMKYVEALKDTPVIVLQNVTLQPLGGFIGHEKQSSSRDVANQKKK